MELKATAVAEEAAALGLPLFKPARLRRNADFLAQLTECRPEALLTASYGQILPSAVLDLTPWPLNVHPSALPQLRGASPVRTALLQGLPATQCCIMRMTPRLDDGAVLLREPCPIPADWNYARLEEELGRQGGRMAVEALDSVQAGAAEPVEQDHANATYCSTYHREDTVIDWRRSAPELCSFIRAWDPDMGAQTSLPDGRRLKVWRAEPGSEIDLAGHVPGTLISADKSGIAVQCGRGMLRILELQPENKRRMSAADFLAGTRLAPGLLLG